MNYELCQPQHTMKSQASRSRFVTSRARSARRDPRAAPRGYTRLYASMTKAVISLLSIVVLSVAVTGQVKIISTPKEHFGFTLGDDYQLANYKQIAEYWRKLDAQSDRLVVQEIGKTAEGRPQLMAIVTSPQNHKRLARLKEISRRMALAEGLTDEQARLVATRRQSGRLDRRRAARHRDARRPAAHADDLRDGEPD